MTMRRWIMVVMIGCLTAATLAGDEQAPAIDDLVHADPAPQGFKLIRRDVKMPDGGMTHVLALSRKGSSTLGMLQIVPQKVSDVRARIASLKGFVNVYSTKYQKLGYAVAFVEPASPAELEKQNFDHPVTLLLRATADGKDAIDMRLKIEFDEDYQFTAVAGSDADEFKVIAGWLDSATRVKPAPTTRPTKAP